MAAPKSFDALPSAFLLSCLPFLKEVPSSLAADVACGYGRHAAAVLALGYDVICIDSDESALKDIAIQQSAKVSIGAASSRTFSLLADLSLGVPLEKECLGLLVAVHYPMLDLVPHFGPLLMSGGYLILETFGGQRHNWKHLPKAGYMTTQLQFEFQVIRYQECRVGPREANAVTVKALARKF
jgi:SAM-dependent methyltransferase